jgi:hypothetical protein
MCAMPVAVSITIENIAHFVHRMHHFPRQYKGIVCCGNDNIVDNRCIASTDSHQLADIKLLNL